MTTKAQTMAQTFPQAQSSPSHGAAFNPLLSGDYPRDFIQAMHQAGLVFTGAIRCDGVIHRFATEKKGHNNGWYVFYGMAGAFGDWSRDIHEKWSLNKERLSDPDKECLREQIGKA